MVNNSTPAESKIKTPIPIQQEEQPIVEEKIVEEIKPIVEEPIQTIEPTIIIDDKDTATRLPSFNNKKK
jgi:hypothetical protein